MSRPHALLFVCYANVCRSPLAEGIFRHLLARGGLEDDFVIDSAGTAAMAGAAPHALSVEAAARHGIALEGRSRQLVREDLFRFDLILVMDRSNARQIRRMASPGSFRSRPDFPARIERLARWQPGAAADAEFPDPVGHPLERYLELHERMQAACAALLDELRARE